MASPEKTLEAVLRGGSDANIRFDDLRQLLLRFGFVQRTSGGHNVFRRAGVRDLINLQKDGSKAKAYQVRQVRRIIVDYGLVDEVR